MSIKLTPTLKKLLSAVDRGTVFRTVEMRQRGRNHRYEFGWSAPCGDPTVDLALKHKLVDFEPPTAKLDNPFVAAGGVGGKLTLNEAGRALLTGTP